MKARYMLTMLLSVIFFIVPHVVVASPYIEELDEQWAFYNEQLIISAQDAPEANAFVDLPIEFDELTESMSGYGTFIKTINIGTERIGDRLAFELPFTYSAAKVFINGELHEEIGRVGMDEATHERNLKSVLLPIHAMSNQLEIAIQISSFEHIRGGFSAAPTIGDWDTLYRSFVMERYMTIFINTIIFIVGVMTLMIGLIERKERMFFTFGLFAIVVAVRGVVTAPFLYHDLPIALSYEWATRIEYFTTNVCFSIYAIFIYLLYNKLFSKWVLYPGLALLWTMALLSLFADIVTFQQAFFSMFPAVIVFVIYNIWIMIRAWKHHLVLAKSLVLGVIFVFIGLIIDFLSGMGMTYAPPIAGIMIALNVLLVMGSLCYNYVQNMRMVTKLNEELDEKVRTRTEELKTLNEELQRLVQLDGLTGVYNRHKFDSALAELFASSTKISLCMIDIDEFKKYNDYYGHVQGDELLVVIAQLMKKLVPKDAVFARYGGEEFAVILPETSLMEASAIAEQIRAAIEYERWPHFGRELQYMTISMGVAERVRDQCDDEVALLSLADARLYESKRNGRNRVTATS